MPRLDSFGRGNFFFTVLKIYFIMGGFIGEVGDFLGDIVEAGGDMIGGYGDNATTTTDLNKAAAERIRLNNEIARQNAIQAKDRNKNIEKLFISAGYIILGMSVLFFAVKIWQSTTGGKKA